MGDRGYPSSPLSRHMKRDGSKLSLTSIDAAPLSILNSPDYTEYNPQLNHIFIDSLYFTEPWHADNFMNVSYRYISTTPYEIIVLRCPKMAIIRNHGD